MNRDLDLTTDYIDVRDIIARVEELREERGGLQDTVNDNAEAEDAEDHAESVKELEAWDTENAEELATLESLLDEMKGNGGDEQWEGDWYPVTLIRDSYFTEAMMELLQDCGDLPRDIPHYIAIDEDATAKNLQVDYASIEIEGETYWYR